VRCPRLPVSSVRNSNDRTILTRHVHRAIDAHRRVCIVLLLELFLSHSIDEHRRIGTFSSLTVREVLADVDSLTEILFDDATKQATKLDRYFEKHGELVGPLHGICMTLKDQFDVEGFDSTLGYVGRSFKPAMQDCVLVLLLKQMGAIIIAKSNLPQSIMVCQRHEASRPRAACTWPQR
jgi:Asp-tRNA(Asn)/Glu-tRNA(Gln) amidotransferase A subunit family amidase